MNEKQALLTRWISIVCLALILLAATKRLIRLFPKPDAELNGDAFWTYLPNARNFLENPFGYLTTDISSLYVAPLGYMWPALWGADPARTQMANCIIFLFSILLMWRLALRLGGLITGIISTVLLTTHPDLSSYIPQVLTESLYLFSFLLFITASTEYLLATRYRLAWLTLASLGLSITLLSRPVLQLFTLAALLLVGAIILFRYLRQETLPEGNELIFSYSVAIALSAALVLPIATIIKNGVYFQFWGISSGAGAGIYYGVSPFKMGIEPVYSGFEYDAGIIPLIADPLTQAHPLKPRSDVILRRVAADIVKNTSFADNIKFFYFKLKAWLFFSPEELRMEPKLRKLRTFEWLSIAFAMAMIFFTGLFKNSTGRWQWAINANLLKNNDGKGTLRVGIFCAMLVLALCLAAQLTPVLYNIRYNLFSLDPLLMPLCGISIGMLLNHKKNSIFHLWNSKYFKSRSIIKIRWLAPRIIIVVILIYIPSVLTKYSVQNRAWSMDPFRPGPTEIVLDNSFFGEPSAMKNTEKSWQITDNVSTLKVPLVFEKSTIKLDFMDAIWRIKLAVKSPIYDRKCKTVEVKISMPAKDTGYYNPEPAIHVPLNGDMSLHAIRGNGKLRPTDSGDLLLTFKCPQGTNVQWGGAQLLRVTLPEAARNLIENGIPINPYRPDDIR